MEIKDAIGKKLNDGDRVYTYIGNKRLYGTLIQGAYPESEKEWHIKYDDDRECIVRNFGAIYKAENQFI